MTTLKPRMPNTGTVPHLVGREVELGQVRRELMDSMSGSPRMVVVAGESGVGKSTLWREVMADAESLTVTVSRRHPQTAAGGRAATSGEHPYTWRDAPQIARFPHLRRSGQPTTPYKRSPASPRPGTM